jgi:hypothetical protein
MTPADIPDVANTAPYSGFPPKLFEDLALETLLFARQATREDVNVAKAMFAMTSAVVRLIASLTVFQVRALPSQRGLRAHATAAATRSPGRLGRSVRIINRTPL